MHSDDLLKFVQSWPHGPLATVSEWQSDRVQIFGFEVKFGSILVASTIKIIPYRQPMEYSLVIQQAKPSVEPVLIAEILSPVGVIIPLLGLQWSPSMTPAHLKRECRLHAGQGLRRLLRHHDTMLEFLCQHGPRLRYNEWGQQGIWWHHREYLL